MGIRFMVTTLGEIHTRDRVGNKAGDNLSHRQLQKSRAKLALLGRNNIEPMPTELRVAHYTPLSLRLYPVTSAPHLFVAFLFAPNLGSCSYTEALLLTLMAASSRMVSPIEP